MQGLNQEVRVVVDTSVARGLGYSERPGWVDTFSAMSDDGYRFSLADIGAGELLIQVRSGRTSLAQHEQMLTSLKLFLDKKWPVLPAGVDLLAMMGYRDAGFDIEEAESLAEIAWKLLLDPHGAHHVVGQPLEEIQRTERQEWVEWLERIARHAEFAGIDVAGSNPDAVAEHLAELARPHMDSDGGLQPPMSIRRHLEIRYRFRQAARTKQGSNPYNPRNPKKQNDGIDVDMYQYLMLPAFVLTQDRGFFGSLASITSFQRNWFKRPEELAAEWVEGGRPAPSWPSWKVSSEC